MNEQDMLKIQKCVLRVNVHCDGCKHKIKKKLQKTEGVNEVRIDVEQGKVTVSGNVDPATLIKKLNKAGKHAELWGPQKGPTPTKNGQFKSMHIGRDSTTPNGGFQATQRKNELRDVRFLGKDQKSVKFRLPEEEEEDDDSYQDDNAFDDEIDEGFSALHQPPTKAHGPQANDATSNGHPKGKSGSSNGWKSKKGSGMHMFFKGILGKAGGESGTRTPRKTHNKAANQKGCGKPSYKNGAIDGKVAAAALKNFNDSWSKKVGEIFDAGPKLDEKQLQEGFNELNKHKGGRSGWIADPTDQMGNFWGGNTGLMGGSTGNFAGGKVGPVGGQMGNFWGGNAGPLGGQIGNFEAVRGLHPATAAGAGNFQGNPYNQQYTAHMMFMNQQYENSYMRSQLAMSYGPPPMTDQYTHIFSDENTGSCSIM